MNIKALRAFRTIVAEGSVIAASRVMNLSQPAVSRLLAQLEGELKLTLFHRTRQRLLLTDEGRAFMREAGRILANLDEIPRIADEIRASRTRRFRIVTMPRMARSVVCPAVARLTRKHPDVQVSVDLRTRRNIALWIAGKEYDIGFGGIPVHHEAIRSKMLVRTRLEVLMPRGHRLEKRQVLTPEDIAGEPIIAQFPSLLLRRQTDELFNTRDIDVHYSLLTSSSQMACQLVAHGAGLTIIDRLSAANFLKENVCLRPLEPARWVEFGALLPADAEADPLVGVMLDCMREEIEEHIEPGLVERP
jgi:DNA-binding transcriptional LysR family regulator